MKRKFLTAGAIMVAALLASVMVAQAADVKFGGVLRPRYEIWEQRGFDANRDASHFINARMRLNANVTIDDRTTAFFQLQANQRWGSGAPATGSAGHNPLSANSGTADVGFHQVYFTLKSFLQQGVDMRVGRQEIVLDAHRLFGNTIWTQGGQSHDAVRFDHQHNDKLHITAFWSKIREAAIQGPGTFNGNAAQDDQDINVYTVWAHYKGVLGGALSLYWVSYQDGTVASEALWHTLGFRQAGNIGGFDYRAEFYYQLGDAGNLANLGRGGALGGTVGGDVSAYMLGLRVGKTFKNIKMKPGITLFLDVLSGSEDSDIAAGDWATFNTLFDTGHKYYGLIDTYLAANGANTSFAGLWDWAVKTKISPADKWTLKADYHLFQTDTEFKDNPAMATTFGVTSQGRTLGTELDLTLVHKYSASTTISAGYSHYWATQLFRQVNGFDFDGANQDGTDQGADWFYLQFNVKF